MSSAFAALPLSGERTPEVRSPEGATAPAGVSFPVATSQHLLVPSSNSTTMVFPSSLNVTTLEAPGITHFVSKVAASHSLIVSSWQCAAKTLLSGDQVTGSHCDRPERAGVLGFVRVFQILTVLSWPPLAKRLPLAENATAQTPLSWPLSLSNSRLVANRHSLIVWS